MSEANPTEFSIKEQKVDNNILTLKVEVDREVVSGAFKRVHKAIAGQLRIPGFRQGKVPMPVLVRYVGKDNFLKEVRRELLPQYYYSAVESLSQRPIENVTYEDVSLAQGEPFSFSATVAVAPRIELAGYDSLSVEKPAQPQAEDAEIDRRIGDMARRVARTENLAEGELTAGNLALVTIEVKIDGEVFQTLGRKNVTMEVGKDQYLTGFDAHLIGRKKGETVEFTMPLEGDTAPKHLVGKEAAFKVELKSIRTFLLPDIDDEFAKNRGFRDLAALREKVTGDILRERQQRHEEDAVSVLKAKLSDMVGQEPPSSTADRRLTEHMARMEERVKSRGMEFDAWLKEEGKSREELETDALKNIVLEMKLEFALDAVAELEKIHVSDKEVEQRIWAMARALDKDPQEVLDILDTTGSRILTKQDIARDRALDLLKVKLLGLASEYESHDHDHDHDHDHEGHSH
ncbi:MAG: trigger factor [Candidatus Wallbacteria bacterium]|nr:trigger factor [Candidatus Wallbacteria bacterium]